MNRNILTISAGESSRSLSIYTSSLFYYSLHTMTTINNYPAEILLEILAQVKLASSAAFFRRCLLVCRSWHDATLPLLYRNIVLSDGNLETFCEGFNPVHSSLVFSLTVRLGPHEPICLPKNTRTLLNHNARRLSKILCDLSKLTTFSFYIQEPFPVLISHNALIPLVNALPESCVNLELDTRRRDVLEADTHLCDQLRPHISRMRHVRISLQFICSALFGSGPLLPGPATDAKDFEPIRLPNIATLMVNCIVRGTNRLPVLCKNSSQVRGGPFENATGWHSITQALQRLVEDKHCPPSARLFVFRLSDYSAHDLRVYTTFVRSEMVSQTALCLPWRFIAVTVPLDGWLLRTQEGRDIFAVSWALNAYAEGEVWKDTMARSRLPAAVLEARRSTFLTVCMEERLPIMSAEEFVNHYPGKLCQLWSNERKAGVKLLEAEMRIGPDAYLSRQPIIEKTPPGFARSRSRQFAALFREGDPELST